MSPFTIMIKGLSKLWYMALANHMLCAQTLATGICITGVIKVLRCYSHTEVDYKMIVAAFLLS